MTLEPNEWSGIKQALHLLWFLFCLNIQKSVSTVDLHKWFKKIYFHKKKILFCKKYSIPLLFLPTLTKINYQEIIRILTECRHGFKNNDKQKQKMTSLYSMMRGKTPTVSSSSCSFCSVIWCSRNLFPNLNYHKLKQKICL